MRAQTCITCEMYNSHALTQTSACVLGNGTVRCSSYRPSSAWVEGALDGKQVGLAMAVTAVDQWEAAETVSLSLANTIRALVTS